MIRYFVAAVKSIVLYVSLSLFSTIIAKYVMDNLFG